MQSPHFSSIPSTPAKTPGTIFTPSTPSISVGDAKKLAEEFNILPLVLNVVEKIRDSTSGRDDTNIILAVNALNEKFQRCKKVIEQLPGTEMSRQEQFELYQKHASKLERKCEQIEEYKALPVLQWLKNVDSAPISHNSSKDEMDVSK